MRFSPSQLPLMGPYLRMACMLYSEQVGVYLQAAGKKGEMAPW